MSQFEETTEGITVRVESFYLEDQSEPSDDHYVWAYRVEVENNGEAVVQLLTRHWVITDSTGKTQEIRGDGVVGHQPVLEPGQSFEYTSGTPLATPSGFMSGCRHVNRSAVACKAGARSPKAAGTPASATGRSARTGSAEGGLGVIV